MRYSLSSILILLALICAPVYADSLSNGHIKYWQLFDSEELDLDQVIGTPNNSWTSMPEGQTLTNALDDHYWQATKGLTLWIKLELPRIVDSESVWVELSPNVGLEGKMAIYENGSWTWKHAAGRHGSEASDFPATFLTFLIDRPREHRIAFLKITSKQVLHFSVNVRDNDKQVSLLASRNLLHGIMFGLMLLAVIYNLVIGISAGERVYIYYATYVLCLSLYVISITGYIRIPFPEWGGNGSFTNLTALLAMFSATVFIRELLETKTTIPTLDILLRAQSGALFISIILLGFVSDLVAYASSEIIGVIAPAVIFISGLSALKKHHPMAKFFLIAWTCFIISGSFWAWSWLGFVPPTLETLNYFLIGTMTEIMMLSILLGYRYSDLKQQTRALAQNSSKYRSDADKDHLTGIYNRQGLYVQIERIIKTSEKDLIWIDVNIDNFGEFNNKYGIHSGDILLSEFGQLLQTKVRRDNLAAKLVDKENSFAYRRGVVGRVGGGQFSVLLSNCSLPQARLYVERLMRDFEALKIKAPDSSWVSTSISVGVIHLLPKEDFHSAWVRANRKLLQAKSQGSAKLAFS